MRMGPAAVKEEKLLRSDMDKPLSFAYIRLVDRKQYELL